MSMIKSQVDNLRKKVDEFSSQFGAQTTEKFEQNSALFLQWLGYLNRYHRSTAADALLDGMASSIREAAACAALGLIRPALFSLRTQVDLALGWIYFKDHPVEWRTVNEFGEGFKLKKELFEYLTNHCPGFGNRYGLLKQTITRKEQDTYRLLSAHIHAQSAIVLPIAIDLQDVVRDEDMALDCASLAGEVSEYINDVFLAYFAKDWAALPVPIMSAFAARMGPPPSQQRSKFFENL